MSNDIIRHVLGVQGFARNILVHMAQETNRKPLFRYLDYLFQIELYGRAALGSGCEGFHLVF